MEIGHGALGIAENEYGSPKHKTGLGAHGTVENVLRSSKLDPVPSVPPKMSSGA
jgi:hypothetical protein